MQLEGNQVLRKGHTRRRYGKVDADVTTRLSEDGTELLFESKIPVSLGLVGRVLRAAGRGAARPREARHRAASEQRELRVRVPGDPEQVHAEGRQGREAEPPLREVEPR